MSPKSEADRRAHAAALRAAGDKLDDLLQLSEADVKEMVEESDRLREEERER